MKRVNADIIAKYFVIASIPNFVIAIAFIILITMNNPWYGCSICIHEFIRQAMHDIFGAAIFLEIFYVLPTAILNCKYMEKKN